MKIPPSFAGFHQRMDQPLEFFCKPFIVLCRPGEEEMMAKILFSETTAIGVRYSEKKRFAMQRRQKTVQTSYGEVAVKICRYGDIEKAYAEYDSARQVSESAGVPLREVMQAAVWAAKEN